MLNSFKESINTTILSSIPHGIIQIPNQSFLNWKDIVKKLQFSSDIMYAEPYIVHDGLLVKNRKIKLINIKSFYYQKYLKKNFRHHINQNNITGNRKGNYRIIISSDLSKYFSIKENDWIHLIFLHSKKKSKDFSLKYFSLQVQSIFHEHGLLDSNTVFLPFNFFKKFFNVNNNIKTIELHMFHPLDSDNVLKKIKKEINSPIFSYNWIQVYKNIYQNIKTIKMIIYFTLLLLIIISCFSIVSILITTIFRKTKEIAILRSIGASNFLIQTIFLYHGLSYIIFGNVIGILISTITILNYSKIMFILKTYFKNNILFDSVYYYNFISLKLDFLDIVFIFISTVIIGIIVNWYPAYYASKIHPNKILK
jgi:lipoprotein-releasing system permease protein